MCENHLSRSEQTRTRRSLASLLLSSCWYTTPLPPPPPTFPSLQSSSLSTADAASHAVAAPNSAVAVLAPSPIDPTLRVRQACMEFCKTHHIDPVDHIDSLLNSGLLERALKESHPYDQEKVVFFYSDVARQATRASAEQMELACIAIANKGEATFGVSSPHWWLFQHFSKDSVS